MPGEPPPRMPGEPPPRKPGEQPPRKQVEPPPRMPGKQPPRKQVDLTTWSPAARWGAVAATILVVVGLALAFGTPVDGPAEIPISAVVAAVIAFAVVAWRRQHR